MFGVTSCSVFKYVRVSLKYTSFLRTDFDVNFSECPFQARARENLKVTDVKDCFTGLHLQGSYMRKG